ncbi:mucin-2-like isoform X2 [Periplaneta americana]|uniref:mucin-2-like isoform X2 n=1 Tax=Periplaneta americana TaxID=6978 RepID=UPI0037E9C860
MASSSIRLHTFSVNILFVLATTLATGSSVVYIPKGNHYCYHEHELGTAHLKQESSRTNTVTSTETTISPTTTKTSSTTTTTPTITINTSTTTTTPTTNITPTTTITNTTTTTPITSTTTTPIITTTTPTTTIKSPTNTTSSTTTTTSATTTTITPITTIASPTTTTSATTTTTLRPTTTASTTITTSIPNTTTSTSTTNFTIFTTPIATTLLTTSRRPNKEVSIIYLPCHGHTELSLNTKSKSPWNIGNTGHSPNFHSSAKTPQYYTEFDTHTHSPSDVFNQNFKSESSTEIQYITSHKASISEISSQNSNNTPNQNQENEYPAVKNKDNVIPSKHVKSEISTPSSHNTNSIYPTPPPNLNVLTKNSKSESPTNTPNESSKNQIPFLNSTNTPSETEIYGATPESSNESVSPALPTASNASDQTPISTSKISSPPNVVGNSSLRTTLFHEHRTQPNKVYPCHRAVSTQEATTTTPQPVYRCPFATETTHKNGNATQITIPKTDATTPKSESITPQSQRTTSSITSLPLWSKQTNVTTRQTCPGNCIEIYDPVCGVFIYETRTFANICYLNQFLCRTSFSKTVGQLRRRMQKSRRQTVSSA